MSAAVDAFRSEATAALEEMEMEIRRALDWIHRDRHDHWHHEVRRGWDKITEARLQLQQARTSRRIADHEPACIDEKRALARAQKRLETAQEKVEAVRHFARAIDHGVDEFRGARAPLAGWLEWEAPKALAALRRMMENLEEYLAMHAAGSGPAGWSAAAPEEAIVAPGDAASTATNAAAPDPMAPNPAAIPPAGPVGQLP
jgi:hypothetical protein